MNSFPSGNSDGSMPPVQRPGINGDTLVAAGIFNVTSFEALVLVGFAHDGILIPYRSINGAPVMVNGRPFYRLRLNEAVSAARYLAPKESGCQLYVPPGLLCLLSPACETVFITEGEFKAISLVEAGFPAVGVGGINSICPRDPLTGKPALLPALVDLVSQFRIKRLAFVGDSDTALLPGFSQEAAKLAQISGVTVVLPRIPFDAPGKAPDDLRDCWREAFVEKWKQIVDAAEVVSVDSDAAQLALRLLRREKEAIRRHLAEHPTLRDKVEARCVKLAAAFKSSPIAADGIIDLCCSCIDARRNAFVQAANEKRRNDAQELAAGRVLDLRQILAPGGQPVLIFDGRSYWRCDGLRWVSICREDARLHLAASVQLSGVNRGDQPSEVDHALFTVQNEFICDFAGPLCGRSVGLICENGHRILVTTGPAFIVPSHGNTPTITMLLFNLFGLGAGDGVCALQFHVFCWWLKIARQAVLNPSTHTPGQVLALVGPKDCGKSFIQRAIITPALGGRSANPTAWLLGRTDFNEDLWAAEHLALGDESLGDDGPDRKRLREEVKKIVASPDYWRHGKFKAGIQLRPVWRVSISANDDPDSIGALPTLEGSFDDKMVLLRCYTPPTPFFDASTPGARSAFSDAINRELPAFLAFIDSFPIPSEWVQARFGFRAWHHPVIVELLRDSSPLAPLEEALEIWRTARAGSGRTLSAVELHQELAELLPAGLRSIASTPARLGKLLSRLSEEPEWRDRLSCCSRRLPPNNRRQRLWVFRYE